MEAVLAEVGEAEGGIFSGDAIGLGGEQAGDRGRGGEDDRGVEFVGNDVLEVDGGAAVGVGLLEGGGGFAGGAFEAAHVALDAGELGKDGGVILLAEGVFERGDVERFGAEQEEAGEGHLLEEVEFMGRGGLEVGEEFFAEAEVGILNVSGKLVDGIGGEAVAESVAADGEFTGRGFWTGGSLGILAVGFDLILAGHDGLRDKGI